MKQTAHGITLIETTIYIGLFGIIMTSMVICAWQIMEGANRSREALAIQAEGTFLMRKINWALTGASDVKAISTSTLHIIRPDLAEETLDISASGTLLMFARGTGMSEPLNDDSLAVKNIVFTVHPRMGDKPTSTTVSFLIQDKPFTCTTYVR